MEWRAVFSVVLVYLLNRAVLVIATPMPGGSCTEAGTFSSHPTDPAQYLMCSNGAWLAMPCAATLVWNQDTATCGRAATKTTPMPGGSCTEAGTFSSHPTDPAQYLMCSNGAWLAMPCAATLVWNQDTATCGRAATKTEMTTAKPAITTKKTPATTTTPTTTTITTTKEPTTTTKEPTTTTKEPTTPQKNPPPPQKNPPPPQKNPPPPQKNPPPPQKNPPPPQKNPPPQNHPLLHRFLPQPAQRYLPQPFQKPLPPLWEAPLLEVCPQCQEHR
ncbi:putative Chitin binding Peritrophin-A domain-containing protein 20, partial [Homarus americanus]